MQKLGRISVSGKQFDSSASRVFGVQVEYLYKQVTGNFVANAITVAAVLAVYWSILSSILLVGWAIYAQVINIAGIVLVCTYHKRRASLPRAVWARLFLVYVAADASTWGVAAWLFYTPESSWHTLFLITILLGTVAGGTTSFVSWLPAVIVFTAGILSPITVRFASEGEFVLYALAGMTVMYASVTINLGVRFHRNLIETWRLQFELQESEAALKQSRDLLEIRVEQRTQELREANEELSIREARYRAVVEVQTELLCRFRPNGDLSFSNEAFSRFFGITPESVTEARFLDAEGGDALLTGEAAKSLIAASRRLTSKRQTATVESLVRDSYGDDRWLMWTLTGLFGGEGQAIEFQALAIDISERKEAEAHIEFLAHHDTLTGLPNRFRFQKKLEEVLQGSPSDRAAIVLFDLDDFKQVNDALGHLCGDALLCEMGKRLEQSVRDVDLVARLGGDEFALIKTDVGRDADIAAAVDKILTILDEPVEIEGNTVQIGASAGITVFPNDGRNADHLLKNADLALYHAKGKNRARAEFFSIDLAKNAERRMHVIMGLRQALVADDKLHMVYQPKIDVANSRVVGCEALIRWSDWEEGSISPAEFVPIAETAGLSVPLGDWVLEHVCRQVHEWQEAGQSIVPVSVNLSAIEFGDFKLIDKVRTSLERYSIDPSLIEFEITETALMDDIEEAVEIMKALVELGTKLSIDDFGTGYSSFSYLSRLPVAEIKIDRAFVTDLAEGSDSRAILRAMVDLGHSLGLRVLAEGVETMEQLLILEEISCDRVQGYFTGMPMSPEAFITLSEARGLGDGASKADRSPGSRLLAAK